MATQEEINSFEELKQELNETINERNQLAQSQVTHFQQEGQENLIRWQLDLKEDLDGIYHLLKGERIGEDEDGKITYIKAKDEDSVPFNEFGLQLIMNVLSFYLNRNTILSNYDEKVINWKILDFGERLADLIHNRYDEMMITIEKKKDESEENYQLRKKYHLSRKLTLFPMIVGELVDAVHSAYLRAYHGGERESLRTARTVTQSEPIGKFGSSNQPLAFSGGRKFSFLRPSTWGGK